MLNLENIKTTETTFLKLIEIIPDAIVIVNNEGKIKHANSKTEEIFGYSIDELLEKEIEILMPARIRNNHVKHRENYATKPITWASGTDL